MSDSPLPRNDDAVTRRYQSLLVVTEVISSYSTILNLFKELRERLRAVVDFDAVAVVLHDYARNCMRLQLRSFQIEPQNGSS